MRHRSITHAVIALGCALTLHAGTRAQEPIASLHGHVVDEAGHGLAGVVVSAQSASLFGLLKTHTTGSGEFAFVALPPGSYVIGFSRDDLVPVKQTMRLTTAEKAVVKIPMHPKRDGEDAITVTSERQVFATSWTTALMSRHDAFDQFPWSGTSRSVAGVVADLSGARPDRSLFLLDGMPLRNGWRLTPSASFAGPGAETLQELAMTPGRLEAGFGRMETGVIEAVTPRGGNTLTGSVRATFDGADMNGDLFREARTADGGALTGEYTLGGPIAKERIWFFASGRQLKQSTIDSTSLSSTLFKTTTRERFGLGKVIIGLGARHRLEGQWIGVEQRAENGVPAGFFLAGDTGALDATRMRDRALSAAFIGRPGRFLDVTLRYTQERGQLGPLDAAAPLDLVARTPLIDQQTGAISWAPGSCGSCGAGSADRDTARATFSTALGGHHLTFGYDVSRSDFDPALRPAGGEFQIYASRMTSAAGIPRPVFETNGSTWIVWSPDIDRRSRTMSTGAFISDRWLPASRLAFDLGVRLDQSDTTIRSDGRTVLSERAISPRLFMTWRPSQARSWTMTAGAARYVPDPSIWTFDAPPGTASVHAFRYSGPPINAQAATVNSSDAIRSLLTWFASQGGTAQASAFDITPNSVTGSRTTAPHVDEYSVGIGRDLGEQGSARVDLTRRSYADQRLGASATPSSLLERRYDGMSVDMKYKLGHYADVEMQYALSRVRGNTGDPIGTGNPFTGAELAYPGYFDPSWHVPIGALEDDARSRFRLWAHTELRASEKHGLFVLTVVYNHDSGHPYGAVGLVTTQPYVVAAQGVTKPPMAVAYYFTPRDEFLTPPITRLDVALSWRRRLPGTVHGEMLAAIHMLNLGDSVRVLHPERLVMVRTAYTDPSLKPFNPFTETPVQGVHWAMDDGTGRSGLATTLPRSFRLVLGIRF